MSADLTGDGKTVLKLHYGKFWVYPAPLFTTAFNPNPAGLAAHTPLDQRRQRERPMGRGRRRRD